PQFPDLVGEVVRRDRVEPALLESLEQMLIKRVPVAALGRRTQVDDRSGKPLGGCITKPKARTRRYALPTSLAGEQLITDGPGSGDPSFDFPPSLLADRVSEANLVGAGGPPIDVPLHTD